jgi:hypothetical protein
VAPGDDLAIIYKIRALNGQLLSHESIHLIDQNLLDELKSIIAQGQYQAYRAVDNIKVRTYWQLGERIVRESIKTAQNTANNYDSISGLSG